MSNLLTIKEASLWATDHIIFQITVEDLQNESMERIGRKLTEEEIDVARKGIAYGIAGSTLDITYNTIFMEMI
jgi:hypothetical protein